MAKAAQPPSRKACEHIRRVDDSIAPFAPFQQAATSSVLEHAALNAALVLGASRRLQIRSRYHLASDTQLGWASLSLLLFMHHCLLFVEVKAQRLSLPPPLAVCKWRGGCSCTQCHCGCFFVPPTRTPPNIEETPLQNSRYFINLYAGRNHLAAPVLLAGVDQCVIVIWQKLASKCDRSPILVAPLVSFGSSLPRGG